jgi:hypothetical protein
MQDDAILALPVLHPVFCLLSPEVRLSTPDYVFSSTTLIPWPTPMHMVQRA